MPVDPATRAPTRPASTSASIALRTRRRLALCAAALAAAAAVPCGAATGMPTPATRALADYRVVLSFRYLDSALGHGPLASMAPGSGAGGALIGSNFFGGSAAKRCGCLLGGVLYATTPEGDVTLLHEFTGADGLGPNGPLVRAPDGLWYGLTLGGGAHGHGTAFRVADDGSRFEVLHSFGAQPAEGSEPAPGPLALAPDGSFYGTTSKGGAHGKGTLFRMTPDGTVSTLHDFADFPGDGWDPEDQPVVDADGTVYGATVCASGHDDRANCGGTLYRLSPTGGFAVLHAFAAAGGGTHPLTSPIVVGDRLYGTTSAGGARGFGTLYGIDVDGAGFALLHEFGGGLAASPPNDDGARPVGRLLAASDGRLYGTTSNGGPNHRIFPAGDGTTFRIATSGDYELLGLLGADAADASHPVGGLVEMPDGYLYGTTDNGGDGRAGTVFRFHLPAVPLGGQGRAAAAPSPGHRRRAGRRIAGVAARAASGGRRAGRRGAKPLVAAAALACATWCAHAQAVPDMVEYAKAWSLVVADFDRDGREDIFIAGHDQEDRIWYGSPTGYRPGAQTFPWHDRHGCVAADVDRDGRPDIFCAIGAVKGTGTKNNELWHQEADGNFTSVANFGAEDPYGRGRRPVFLDLDHDGWPDLYLTNDSELRKDGHENVNRMFLNRHDLTFAEVRTIATGSSARPGQPGDQCAVRGDVDGDGWDDLLVCNATGPGRIFINDHANDFTLLATAAIGSGWHDARLEDMDDDGRDDLVVLTLDHRLQVWLNTGSAPYFVAPALDAALPADADSLTTGHFDADARKDIYVVLHHKCSKPTEDPPDALFHQRKPGQWTMERLTQHFGGCGSLAATIGDNQVLLANGTLKRPGPNYVLSFRPD